MFLSAHGERCLVMPAFCFPASLGRWTGSDCCLCLKLNSSSRVTIFLGVLNWGWWCSSLGLHHSPRRRHRPCGYIQCDLRGLDLEEDLSDLWFKHPIMDAWIDMSKSLDCTNRRGLICHLCSWENFCFFKKETHT